ncbi:hypothetical protein [Fischerella thermalis]|nr:hypothetical protein [Fischerella thermalis]
MNFSSRRAPSKKCDRYKQPLKQLMRTSDRTSCNQKNMRCDVQP